MTEGHTIVRESFFVPTMQRLQKKLRLKKLKTLRSSKIKLAKPHVFFSERGELHQRCVPSCDHRQFPVLSLLVVSTK